MGEWEIGPPFSAVPVLPSLRFLPRQYFRKITPFFAQKPPPRRIPVLSYRDYFLRKSAFAVDSSCPMVCSCGRKYTEMTSILIVDDNPVFAHSVARFLQAREEFEVAGIALSGKNGLEQAQGLKPDLVLLDPNLEDMCGLESVQRLRDLLPRSGLIVLSWLDTECFRRSARRRGASAVVSKAAWRQELLPALRDALPAAENLHAG